MPPGQTSHRDPNVIDVSLSLLGAQSEVAVLALTDQIRMLNEHFAATGTLSAAAQAQGSSRVIQTSTAARQQAIYEGGPSPTASVNYTGPQGAAQPPVEGGTHRRGTSSGAGDGIVSLHERGFFERLGLLSRAARGQDTPEYQPNPDASRAANLADYALRMARPPGRLADTADEREVTGQSARPQRRGSDGQPSSGASTGGPGDSAVIYGPNGEPISRIQTNDTGAPVGGGEGTPSWIRHSRMDTLEDQMQWPRIGEVTTQNKLQIASDMLARLQLRKNDRKPGGSQWYGNASAALGIAANNYTQIRAFGTEAQKLLGAAGISRAGEQAQAGLGYSQAGGTVTIPGTSIGGEIPFIGPLFSEAGRQSIHRQMQIFGLSTQSQISRQQAQEMYDVINGQGYSGGEADRLAHQLYAPLVRQGASSNVIGSVTNEAYRYGNTSITDLRNSLKDLGETARTTKQSVDQVIEGLGAFANTAAEHGSTLQQGLLHGREFVGATGMRPEVAARALDNPLFQGLAMQQTGLLPTQQGTMTGTEIAATQSRMVNLGMQMTRGFNRPRTERVTDAHGRVITRQISGRDAQIAQAASMVGMDPETFRQALRHQGRQNRYTAAETALRAWSDDVHHTGTMTETGDRAGHATAAENALQRGAGGRNHLNWNQVAQELADAGVSRSRIHDISQQNFRDRIHSAQQELEKSRDPERSGDKRALEVRFTGLAEKWLTAKMIGDSKGHSDTTPWKTAAGVGLDIGKFALSPASAVSKILGG